MAPDGKPSFFASRVEPVVSNMRWDGGACARKALGFTAATQKVLLQAVQDAAIQWSRFTFLCRLNENGDPKRYETHGETLENLSSGHRLLIEVIRLTVWHPATRLGIKRSNSVRTGHKDELR